MSLRALPEMRRFLRLQPKATPLFNTTTIRLASSSIKPPRKPIVLEKPAKFTPPSHSARLPRRAPRGAALPTYERSERDKEEGKRKQYPHMMPPEGTFLHWFLTNRTIHVWITMVKKSLPIPTPFCLLLKDFRNIYTIEPNWHHEFETA